MACLLSTLLIEYLRLILHSSLSAKKVLYAIFFSGDGIAIHVPVKIGKSVAGKNTTKMWYWRNWKNTIRNSTQSWVSNMFNFYMIMPQLIRLPLLQFILAKKDGYSFTKASLFTRPCLLLLLFFWNWKPSSLDRQVHGSAFYQYLNQHTVMHSGSKFINWNYAFLVMETTLRAWNKEICDYFHFECSLST